MSNHRLLGGVATLAIAVGGLAALPSSAGAVTPADLTTTQITVTAPSEVLDTSQTRATGHNDFLENALHVWTEGNTSTDKAAGYIAQDESLADLVSYGEPSLDWTPTSQDLPQAPGEQIVVDFDGDGTPDGILVGEPAFYGNEWWLSSDAQQWVRDGAPHNGGGYGSPYYGTLAEWSGAFADAEVTNVGYSMGSGVHGDGVISSMSYGNTTYTFALGLGPCQALQDATTQTYTLTQDCSTFETINVDNGWTVDGADPNTGNPHTITAVEDSSHPNFPGPVVLSASGDDTGPATMNVENLDIATQFSGANSGGQLAGIKFARAGGDVDNVTITGITHGNGVQEGNALYVRNRDASGSSQVPLATVTVENVTVTDYQKTGVIFDGNVDFTMTGSVVGPATDEAGNPLTSIGANAVQVSRAAHGSITNSSIGLNEYNPDPAPGDGSDATGILVYDAKTVTLQQNVIAGGNGDVGLDTYNDTFGVIDTTVNASCNLFQRNETDDPYDPYGVGVSQWNDGSTPVTLNLSDNSFSGWKYDTGMLDGTPPNLTVGPGADNEHLGNCPASAPTDVTATGGDRQTDVSWAAASAPDYAPVTGYQVTVNGEDGSTQTVQVDADTTTAHIAGLLRGVDYTVAVTALSEGGNSDPATTQLHKTALDLQAAQSRIVFGGSTVLNGTLSSSDTGADLTGRPVVILRRAVGVPDARWRHTADVTTAADGTFSTTVQPSVNTVYRAVYKGAPDLSSNSRSTRVNVAPKISVVVSDRTVTQGTTVLFVANATPDSTGQPAFLQQLVGDTWTDVKQGTLGSHGQVHFRWVAHPAGVSTWRVLVPHTATRAAGISHRIAITVS